MQVKVRNVISGIVIMMIPVSIYVGANYLSMKKSEDTVQTSIETISQFSILKESWPAQISQEIPPLESGVITKFEDLQSRPRETYQPEKILFILHMSDIADTDITAYFKKLVAASWKMKPITRLMGGNLSYRAEKGEYIITIEDDTYGKDTAYYYVELSVTATNRLSN